MVETSLKPRIGLALAALALTSLVSVQVARADAPFGATDTFTLTHSWQGHTESVPCGPCPFPLEGLCICPPASLQQGVSTQLGGPEGALDVFLQLSPLSATGVESWNVASNRTGDYNAVGITGITIDLKNLGASTLYVRVGVERGPTRWVSSDLAAAEVPVSSGWGSANFPLQELAMTRVAGSDPLSWVLDRVEEVRILHSATASWTGGSGSTLGVDNVVLPEPGSVPAFVSGVGLVVALARRRRRSAAAPTAP
jgi:hypothetical protein